MELGKPALKSWFQRRKNLAATRENEYVRHERDFDLQPLPKLGKFIESIYT